MFDFSKDFTIKGKWWIFKEKNLQLEASAIFGLLTYNVLSGLSLIAEGSLLESTSLFQSKHNFTISIVVGLTQENYHITLFNCYGNELGTNNWIYTELQIEYALLCREHYFAVEHMQINKINFSTNFFSSFLFNVSAKLKADHKDDLITFKYEEKPPLTISKNEIYEAYFFFYFGYEGLGHTRDFKFRDRIFLNFDFIEPIFLKDAVANVKFYKDLFTFFSYRRVLFEKVSFFTKDTDQKLVEFNFLCKPQSSEEYEVTATYDVLLSYKDLDKNFSIMFETWFNNQVTINSGLLLYLQTKNLKFSSPIQIFLNMVFAIETLHNTYYRNKYLNFFQRLKDLIDRNQILSEFIYDVDDFCKKVRDHRNYLAHNHSEITKAVIPEKYYKYFNLSLQMIFECNFLKILKLGDENIILYLKRHYSYQNNKIDLVKIRDEFFSQA